jgi:S-formylglutathione hydrolase FrmB
MNLKHLIITCISALATASASAFTVDTITIADKLIPEPMKITVYTPDGAQKGVTPSVYLLNGYGGDYRSWSIIRPDLGELADQYGMLFVLPSGMNSWYWDAPKRPEMQMESFITKKLVPYIDEHYPTAPVAEKRAITGLSMGGHGGLWLGLRHPDIWHNIGSTSGGVYIVDFQKKWDMIRALGDYDMNKDIWNSHTILNMVPDIKPGQNIIIDCGSEDFFADVNKRLHNALLDAKIPHDYISRPGAHNIPYWNNSILYQLLYFSTKFPKE